jgi:4a-hydroxytetrahydrobiopterin dehydratase
VTPAARDSWSSVPRPRHNADVVVPEDLDLARGSCEPCRGGIPPLASEEVARLAPQVPGWEVVEEQGIPRLRRDFEFRNFREALDFAVRVGEIAEREQHHPDLHVAWGRVRVDTWTHKIKGLHRNDFVLAAKIDALQRGPAPSGR